MSLDLARDFRRALDPSSIAADVGIEQLDDWQSRLIDDPPKRLLACCGRQVGKSTAAALVALHRAIYSAPSTIVLVSPSLRQSSELFRTFRDLYQRLPGRPEAQYETLTRLTLANGSRVLSLPGTEQTIRGIPAVDLVIVDEAARVSDELLAAVRPMLATTNGSLFALSTPAGRRGWFYDSWSSGSGWSRVMVKSTECARIDPAFLQQERLHLGPIIFSEEYECAFVDDAASAFAREIIDRAFVDYFPPFRSVSWA